MFSIWQGSRVQRRWHNLFQKGLRALFAHDKDAVTARDRERIGERLWHAYRHFVPPTFLAGFLRQIPSAELLQRAASKEIEPGFKERVVEKLFRALGDGNLPEPDIDPLERRGRYPRQVEREAKRRLSNLTETWN